MKEAFKEYFEVERRIKNAYHEAAVKMQMSDSEMDILYILYSYPEGCNQSILYKQSSLTRSTVNTALKKMERNGVLSILPGEGRNTRVVATDNGRKLIENTVCRVIAIENEIYDSWSQEEQELFMRINRDYAEKLSEKVKGM